MDITGQVATLLDELAVRFGATAEHLWAVLIRQEVLNGWIGMIGAAFCLTLAGIGFVVARWGYRKETPSEWRDEDQSAALTAGSFACVVFAVAASLSFLYGLKHLLNPEFYAFQYILKALGG